MNTNREYKLKYTIWYYVLMLSANIRFKPLAKLVINKPISVLKEKTEKGWKKKKIMFLSEEIKSAIQ